MRDLGTLDDLGRRLLHREHFQPTVETRVHVVVILTSTTTTTPVFHTNVRRNRQDANPAPDRLGQAQQVAHARADDMRLRHEQDQLRVIREQECGDRALHLAAVDAVGVGDREEVCLCRWCQGGGFLSFFPAVLALRLRLNGGCRTS